MNKIIFKKKNLLDISGLIGVDMHIHTQYSGSLFSANQLLNAAKKKNIGLAITDHNDIAGFLEIDITNKDVLLIPGIEVTAKEGPDILFYFNTVNDLVLFYEKYVKPYRGIKPQHRLSISLPILLKGGRKLNAFISIAHPYISLSSDKNIERYLNRTRFFELLKLVDAIEIINSHLSRRANLKAIELCQKYGKKMTGGSDARSTTEVGRILTYGVSKTPKDFLDYLRGNDTIIIGKENNFLNILLSHSQGIPKRFVYIYKNLQKKIKKINNGINNINIKIAP